MTLEEHCQLQRKVVNRLYDAGYKVILQNHEYRAWVGKHEVFGEVDILALSPHDMTTYHFYEIKSCKHKLHKAQEQYDRFKQAFPNLAVKGVFVSYGKVRQLNNEAIR